MASPPEPRWLSRLLVDTIHHELVREHGGSQGVRDDGLIESALARPVNRRAYESDVDIPALAAAYAFGLARNHGYIDGNKRVAFMAMYVFLELHGLTLDVSEPDAVSTMTRVADGSLTEDALAAWIRSAVK